MKLPKVLILKRTLLSFVLLFPLFLFILTKNTLAYTPSRDGTDYIGQFSAGLESPSWEKSSFDFTTVMNIMESISTAIIGSDRPDINQSLGSSAFQSTNNLIASLYQRPPASSVQYFADLGERLKITKPVYAQGVGFEGLNPVLGLWKSFRNSAYIIFALILVFVGFAVMFRLKINPQTVVTIQSAIPKIIIALILITFSYAIGGFLIDLIYVFIFLFKALINPQQLNINNAVFMEVRNILGDYWGAVDTIELEIREFANDLLALGIPGLGKIIGSLGKVVLAIAIIFASFKLFFNLLICYISILAGIIFSPLMLMLEAIPGQKGLMNWIKMMMANIVPFPIVAIMFMVGSKIIDAYNDPGSGPLWVAPFLGSGSTSTYVPALIGIAIIIATPSVVASVQKAIGTPGIAGMAAGVIAPVTAAWGAMRGAAVGAYRLGRQGYEMTPYAKRRQAYQKVSYEREAEEALRIRQPSGTGRAGQP